MEKVAAYFQPEKFSTAKLIKTAATPVPESKQSIKQNGKWVNLATQKRNYGLVNKE